MNNLTSRLRQFDAYPKTLEDFRIKTFSGAAVTVISGLLMLVLFVSELNFYLTTDVQAELLVDTSRGQKLRINLDVTFPLIGCSFLSVDAMDVSGDQQIDLDHSVFKQRLNSTGHVISDNPPEKQEFGNKTEEALVNTTTLDPNRCESCYGAETKALNCCNTCDEVKEAYKKRGWAFDPTMDIAQCKRDGLTQKLLEQRGEGCRVYGYLEVNKVAGNLHIAPGRSFQQHHIHVHDVQSMGGQKFNTSHVLNHISFGRVYPGQLNPLDGLKNYADKESLMFQYFVKVVPTTFVSLSSQVLYSNQFSVTKHSKVVSGGLFGEQGLPGVFFSYELSPMMVKYTEKQRSFMHFLTGVCAIVGGVFTVAGLIDSLLYHSQRALQRKMELGKTT